MVKRLATAGLVLGLGLAAAPLAPAAAADCGLAALLAPCVTGPPPPPPAAAVPTVLDAPAAPAPATPEPVPAPTAAPSPATRTAVPAAADRLLQLVNEARGGAGLPALRVDPRAASIALGHSTAMAERGDIFHNSGYFSAATRASLGARALGENVAMNGSVEAAHQRLMASPGHRANILSAAFDAVGMAVVRDAGGTLFVTQDFLDSAGTAAPAPPRPAASPPAAPPRPAATYRVAGAPAPAAAPATPGAVSGPAPGAVLSAGDPPVVASRAADTAAAHAPGSRLGMFAAAALTLLVSVAGTAIRLVVRA